MAAYLDGIVDDGEQNRTNGAESREPRLKTFASIVVLFLISN